MDMGLLEIVHSDKGASLRVNGKVYDSRNMLIGIISDLHANLEATRAVLTRLDDFAPDLVVCLGDVTGYNAEPNEVVDIIRERQFPILMGNHDAVACGLEEPWFFNAKAQTAIRWHAECLREDNKVWIRNLPEQIPVGDLCLCVHGSPGNRDDYILDWLDAMRQLEYLDGTRTRICFFGHSHRAGIFGEKGGGAPTEIKSPYALSAHNRYFINPGSVGQPRDGDPRAAFGLLDTDTMIFTFQRVEYDIAAAARKVIECGLPEELAQRLEKGK